MNLVNFIESMNLPLINCVYCHQNINLKLSNNNYSNITRYRCDCDNISLDIFSKDKISFYMNLQDNYNIKIHTFLFNKPIVFSFDLIDPLSSDAGSRFLSLDYIPDLNWKDSSKLLDQLKLLTTFI